MGDQQASGPEVQLPPAFAQTRKDCTYWGPKPQADHKASSGRLWDQHLLWPLGHWTPASFQKPLLHSLRHPETQKHSAYLWAHNLRRSNCFYFPCANKGLQVNAHAQPFKLHKTWKRLCRFCSPLPSSSGSQKRKAQLHKPSGLKPFVGWVSGGDSKQRQHETIEQTQTDVHSPFEWPGHEKAHKNQTSSLSGSP